MALFVSLAIYGITNAPLNEKEGVWFAIAFFVLFALIPIGFLCSLYALLTVRCGNCEGRYFDLIFLSFPVQGGCRNCHAPIANAITRSLGPHRYKQ